MTTSPAVKRRKNERVRPRRDFHALEQRRMKAVRMFEKGKRQADVVHALGVSRPTASDWYAKWSAGGKDALKAAGRAGRLPKLDHKDLQRVEKALLKGAKANGFATELWTLARVADVIERETGVRYHEGHVWKILKAMGWSRQKPARRAIERDEEAIETWKKDRWPAIKKAHGVGGPGLSSKTNPQ
jgi:transposase